MPDESLSGRVRSAILSLELAPRPAPQRARPRTRIRRIQNPDPGRPDAPRGGGTRAARRKELDRRAARPRRDRRALRIPRGTRIGERTARVGGEPDRDDLEALVELADAVDEDETPEHSLDAGTSFHLELARLSGNAFLLGAMEGALTPPLPNALARGAVGRIARARAPRTRGDRRRDPRGRHRERRTRHDRAPPWHGKAARRLRLGQRPAPARRRSGGAVARERRTTDGGLGLTGVERRVLLREHLAALLGRHRPRWWRDAPPRSP